MTKIQKWVLLSVASSPMMTGCQESADLFPEGSKASLVARPEPVEKEATPETPSPTVIPTEVEPESGLAEATPVVVAQETTETKEQLPGPVEEITEEVTDGGNTAGGIGTARVKDKTLTEEVVPEEARKLTAAVMEKIPPILRGLRDSGRLSWKMAELDDDVLILNWKQEQFVLGLSDLLVEYLFSIMGVHEDVQDRILPVGSSWLYLETKDRLAEGEFVNPEFRRAVRQGEFGEVPASLSGFLQPEVLSNVYTKSQHPLLKLQNRLVAEDLRRSDLFFMLIAYRIATDDYARILTEEGEFDRVIGIRKFSELCPKGESFIKLVLTRPNGEEVEMESRGHFYLPRNHQANFEAAHGRYWPERNAEADKEEGGTLSDKIFRKPLPKVPPREFLTTVETPKHRDSLAEQRQVLDKQISTLVELLGPEWAEFDFVVRPIISEDT